MHACVLPEHVDLSLQLLTSGRLLHRLCPRPLRFHLQVAQLAPKRRDNLCRLTAGEGGGGGGGAGGGERICLVTRQLTASVAIAIAIVMPSSIFHFPFELWSDRAFALLKSRNTELPFVYPWHSMALRFRCECRTRIDTPFLLSSAIITNRAKHLERR